MLGAPRTHRTRNKTRDLLDTQTNIFASFKVGNINMTHEQQQH
jgi:hypothetical protein